MLVRAGRFAWNPGSPLDPSMEIPRMAASHARSHPHHGSPAERTLHGPHRNVTRFLALLLVGACGTTDSTEVVDPIPTTMEITVASVQMTFLGENRQLVARVLDQNGKVISSEVTWLSDNLDVVTVSAAIMSKAATRVARLSPRTASGVE